MGAEVCLNIWIEDVAERGFWSLKWCDDAVEDQLPNLDWKFWKYGACSLRSVYWTARKTACVLLVGHHGVAFEETRSHINVALKIIGSIIVVISGGRRVRTKTIYTREFDRLGRHFVVALISYISSNMHDQYFKIPLAYIRSRNEILKAHIFRLWLDKNVLSLEGQFWYLHLAFNDPELVFVTRYSVGLYRNLVLFEFFVNPIIIHMEDPST